MLTAHQVAASSLKKATAKEIPPPPKKNILKTSYYASFVWKFYAEFKSDFKNIKN